MKFFTGKKSIKEKSKSNSIVPKLALDALYFEKSLFSKIKKNELLSQPRFIKR